MDYIENESGKRLVWIFDHVIEGPITFQRHHHAFLEMSCVLRGTGTYQVNGEDYDMRPGDVFLFAPTDQHNLQLGNETLEHIVVHLDPSFIWNALGNDMDYKFLMVFFRRGPHFRCRLDRDNPAAPLLNQWFREIWQECREQRDCYELMIKIRIQSILAQIIRSYDCIDKSAADHPASGGELEHINQVLQYIDDHLGEELRLSELAAVAHISPSYFSAVFKRYNGLPPVEYVVARRVRRAVELIRTTDLPLAEVASVCGFNNTTNFYKAFRRVTGRTPASYRNTKGIASNAVTPGTVNIAHTVYTAPAPAAAAPAPAPAETAAVPDYSTDPCQLCTF